MLGDAVLEEGTSIGIWSTNDSLSTRSGFDGVVSGGLGLNCKLSWSFITNVSIIDVCIIHGGSLGDFVVEFTIQIGVGKSVEFSKLSTSSKDTGLKFGNSGLSSSAVGYQAGQ